MAVWKRTAQGLGVAIGVVLLMITLYAAIAAGLLHFTEIAESSMEKWNGLAGAAAVLVGSLTGSAFAGQKGFHIGLLTALSVIGTGLFLKEILFEWSHLIHYGLLLASGMAGGIAGVNLFGRSAINGKPDKK
ncbi:TIGR04086 family membrane protein [Jeotgalibacillus haloalkalitolerans]|uniref:TIGR04086 family membrane protein n=1 Tax=Jeotgalibacillus haloalkalitolerans TaxID=3104292 RepID=A0ABU5KMG5_9BACL|nr:TIGR04086 family membrane protein [Jeotgalibacillus sp. HH7-29]MDZ5712334.1 TIGR04086 family membrane protein [Jeotgalibacillus sp. HH7-29]